MKKFFSYSTDNGFLLHRTADKAKAEAEANIDYYRDGAFEGWPEEVDSVCWGEVNEKSKQTELQERPDACDYKLATL